MNIEKVDISRILVNNKYRLPVTEFDTAVYVVDIPKASQLILDLINTKIMEEIKLSVFSLVKELKKDPESICLLLQEHLFKNFETISEKGMITIKLPYAKETTTETV